MFKFKGVDALKYNQETYEVIRERILNHMSNDIDKREGSFVSNMISPAAVEFAKYYIELDNILSIMFFLRCAEIR